IASCGQLGLGSAAPFGGSRGHRLVPSSTNRRAPAANSLASLVNPLAPLTSAPGAAQQARPSCRPAAIGEAASCAGPTDTVEGRDGNILKASRSITTSVA